MKESKKRLSCSENQDECSFCDLVHCSLMKDLVSHANRLAPNNGDYVILRHLVDSIVETEYFPVEAVILTHRRAEKKALLHRAHNTLNIMGSINNPLLKDIYGILQKGNYKRLEQLDAEIMEMENRLNAKTHQTLH